LTPEEDEQESIEEERDSGEDPVSVGMAGEGQLE
jgi:hypothetical protein